MDIPGSDPQKYVFGILPGLRAGDSSYYADWSSS
jgi:hypothetical protein